MGMSITDPHLLHKSATKWKIELLIIEIIGNVLDYTVPQKKVYCLFVSITSYISNIIVSTAHTLS